MTKKPFDFDAFTAAVKEKFPHDELAKMVAAAVANAYVVPDEDVKDATYWDSGDENLWGAEAIENVLSPMWGAVLLGTELYGNLPGEEPWEGGPAFLVDDKIVDAEALRKRYETASGNTVRGNVILDDTGAVLFAPSGLPVLYDDAFALEYLNACGEE